MTVLLLGPFSVLPFFCIAQSLLMQKTTAKAKLIVLGILYIQPLLGSSRSANPCLCTLSSTHHVWPSSASPHLSSQGTVNSMMLIFIVADHKSMSGLKFVFKLVFLLTGVTCIHVYLTPVRVLSQGGRVSCLETPSLQGQETSSRIVLR